MNSKSNRSVGRSGSALPAGISTRAGRFTFVFNPVTLNAMRGLIVELVTCYLLLDTCLADTTWVSGAVSGVWNADGKPWIVEDSTWVPEGERVTWTTGVEAFFDEWQGLYVFGTLNTEKKIVFKPIILMR